jgi:hypothetical protein
MRDNAKSSQISGKISGIASGLITVEGSGGVSHGTDGIK